MSVLDIAEPDDYFITLTELANELSRMEKPDSTRTRNIYHCICLYTFIRT